MPTGVTYVSDTKDHKGMITSRSNADEWDVGSIDARRLSATLTITATVDAGTLGTTITNTASVTIR